MQDDLQWVKHLLATNIAFNAAKNIQENGKKSSVAFFSLEMSSEQFQQELFLNKQELVQMILDEEEFQMNNLINF